MKVVGSNNYPLLFNKGWKHQNTGKGDVLCSSHCALKKKEIQRKYSVISRINVRINKSFLVVKRVAALTDKLNWNSYLEHFLGTQIVVKRNWHHFYIALYELTVVVYNTHWMVLHEILQNKIKKKTSIFNNAMKILLMFYFFNHSIL